MVENVNNKKVSVIGIGRLGLSFALLLDSKGYDVYGCDVDESYVESLKNKSFISKEPQVNELLTNSTMSFTTYARNVFNHSDTIFVFVPTPSKDNGEYDHKYVDQVVHEMVVNEVRDKTLIICATIMPTYSSSIQDKLSEFNVKVVYHPFFIAQGSIINDLTNADIVLIGGDVPEILFDIHHTITEGHPKFKQLSLLGAEIAKISLNCFLTTKIAFANRIGEICINSGIEEEVSKVLEAIGSDSRVGNKFLRYGYGFSGVCLPRDNKALGIHSKKIGIGSNFQEVIDSANNQHLLYLYSYFIGANPDKSVPFVFYQLSYKNGVDILTESQPLQLCKLLLQDGYKVNIVESDSVIEQAKVALKKYEGNVFYFEDKTGFKINLR